MLRSLRSLQHGVYRHAQHITIRPIATAKARGRPRKDGLKSFAQSSSPHDSQHDLNAPASCHSDQLSGSIKHAEDGVAGRRVDDNPTTSTPVPVKRGRPRKSTIVTSQDGETDSPKRPRKARKEEKRPDPPRVGLTAASQHHNDLPSFLAYADRIALDPETSVYKGTHYEYIVAQALQRFGLALHRSGRANDLGIDLIGTWGLPEGASEAKVLVQCKVTKSNPAMVRELEGAYVGAPAGWRGSDVLAMLVSCHPTTEGVRSSLQRSRLPLCYLQITPEGSIVQFLWNHVAKEARLTGMSVARAYSASPSHTSMKSVDRDKVKDAISLLWLDRPWRGRSVNTDTVAMPTTA